MAVTTAPEEFYIHPQTGEKIMLGAAPAQEAQQVAAVKAGLAAKIAEIEAFAKEEELKLEAEAKKLLGGQPDEGAAPETPSFIEEEVSKIETAVEGVYEKVKSAVTGSKSAAK